jgi:lysophospholipase L1-like esterase
MLAVLVAGSFILAWLVARRCRKSGKLEPAFKVLLPVLAFLAVGIAGEIILRVSSLHPFEAAYDSAGLRRSLLFGFEAAPKTTRSLLRTNRLIHARTDQFGFRTNLNHPNWAGASGTNAALTPRPLIFTVGESSTFGAGLDDTEAWPHLLETELGKAGHPVTVVNAGNNGQNSLQTLLRLYLRVVPHKPDVLICYLGHNDVARQERQREAVPLINESQAFTDTMACYVRAKNAGKNPYCRTLLYHHLTLTVPKTVLRAVLGEERYARVRAAARVDSYAGATSTSWKRVYAALRSVRKGDQSGTAVPESEKELDRVIVHNAQRLTENIQTMIDMCKRRNIRVVLTTFGFDKQRIEPYFGKSMSHYNEQLRRLAREEGVVLVDIEAHLNGAGDTAQFFFADHYHPSPAGAAEIARVLARSFNDWGKAEKLTTTAAGR